jgi:hypothetical protein
LLLLGIVASSLPKGAVSTKPGQVQSDIYTQGLEVERPLAELIDEKVRLALAGLERRVLRVHLRLYGGQGSAGAVSD